MVDKQFPADSRPEFRVQQVGQAIAVQVFGDQIFPVLLALQFERDVVLGRGRAADSGRRGE